MTQKSGLEARRAALEASEEVRRVALEEIKRRRRVILALRVALLLVVVLFGANSLWQWKAALNDRITSGIAAMSSGNILTSIAEFFTAFSKVPELWPAATDRLRLSL